MKYGTGHVRETAAHTPFERLSEKLGASSTTGASLLSHTSPVMNQRQTGSCEGHGVSGAIYCALGAASQFVPWVPSQAGIYGLGRAVDRRIGPDGRLPKLTDSGAMTSQVIRGIAEWGIHPMGPIVGDAFSDVDPATINDEPRFADLEADAQHLVIGAYGITSWGRGRSDDVAQCLSAGVPVVLAIAGGSDAFQAYSGGVLGPLNAPVDHCVFVYAFSTAGDGSRIFTIRNSWGGAWGETGDVRISEDCLAQCADLVAMKVELR